MKYLWALTFVVTTSSLWAQTRITGDVEGVEYIIDIPENQTGKVMFIARGFRPEFFPLSAVYEVGTRFYQTMLEDGWTIASTAFRTNEWVVAKGAEDILALQAFIDREVHPIKQSIIYGETMGGGVAVWLAENKPETFSGVLCLGAHLFVPPTKEDEQLETLSSLLSATPNLPVVLMANGHEIRSSQLYIEAIKDTPFPPVTYYVERTGHVNVNSAERLTAMGMLLDWIDGKTPKSVADGTIQLSPESVAAISTSSAAGNIRLIRPLYGNIYTNFVKDDLEKLGINLSDSFEISHKQQTHNITYAKAYSDVPYGEWVAFIDPEGYVQVSRNYANASETLGANIGEPLLITHSKQ